MTVIKITEKRSKYVSGFIGMVVGPIFVFGTVLLMNRMGDEADKTDQLKPTEMTVVKQEKPKPKKKVEKPKPKARPKQTRAPAPITGLNSSLSGIDLGLSGLGTEELDVGDNGLLGNANASVMTEDSVDTMPQPKVKSSFVYPKTAKKRNIEGYVVLSLLIDVDGTVDKIQVLESSPQGVFDDSAVAGIRNWRFTPAQYQGKAVKVWAKQKIRFGLG
ncbi:energy transducer TonB [Methylobacter luteus]|uniref:energy transducer TonB n=1 Tax=Methylobacter luteus TaxID=415 RepID=UPI0004881FD0|nr:energy transducer TonB [Methylobacter luteus]